MQFINQKLIGEIPRQYRKTAGYYPDMMLYQHNENDYIALWQAIAATKFVYTDGYGLRPAGLVRFVFETVKGWLGFTNHCLHETVQLSLRKFAYYGYLKNYSAHYVNGIPNKYIDLIRISRNPETSKAIQEHLIKYCCKYPVKINIDIAENFDFGSTLIKCGLRHQAETLGFIQTRTSATQTKITHPFIIINQPPEHAGNRQTPVFFSESTPRKPLPVTKPDPNDLTYWLKQKDYAQLVKYLEQNIHMPGIHTIINKIPLAKKIELITKNTPLALLVAETYHNNLQVASTFDNNLSEKIPKEMFRFMIQESQFEEAYIHYNKMKKIGNFDRADCSKLAKHFDSRGNLFYEKALELKKDLKWEEAKKNYFDSYQEKIKAFELEPTKDTQSNLDKHKRLYAELLIDADIVLNTLEINSIDLAIELLNSCTKINKNGDHDRAFAKALMRSIDFYNSNSLISSAESDNRAHNQVNNEHVSETLGYFLLKFKKSKDPEILPLVRRALQLQARFQESKFTEELSSAFSM